MYQARRAAQRPRAKNWCFTLNVAEGEAGLLDSAIPDSAYCVYQYELAPQTGRLHVQGYVSFASQALMTTVKQVLFNWSGIQGHLEIARGTPEQNKAYCTKAESRAPNTEPREFGELPGRQGQRTDLTDAFAAYREAGEATEELMEGHGKQLIIYGARFRQLKDELDSAHWKHRTSYFKKKVIILWGEQGTGKTRQAIEAGAVKAKYSSRYVWGHYRGEPVVLFDEFNGQVPIEEMLELCDGYRTTVQIPYMGNKPWIPHTVYICSNNEYKSWWQKATVEQLKAFWRRVSQCVHFSVTPLGIRRAWQKGRSDDPEPTQVMDLSQEDPIFIDEVEPIGAPDRVVARPLPDDCGRDQATL